MKHSSITLVLAFVSTAFLALPGFAQQQGPPGAAADSIRRAAAAQFQADHGPAWQVLWSEKTGTPATLMSGTAKGYGGPPEQAGRAFLRDHRQLFGIENPQRGLEVARKNTSEGKAQVLYQQIYRGVPVLYSGYLVALNESAGEVYYASGDYYPDIEVKSVQPSLTPSGVVRRMRDDLGGGGRFEVLQEPKLAVFVNDKREKLAYHLAYEARAERRDPLEAYKYVFDALDGAVLQKISLVEDTHMSRDLQQRTGTESHGGAAGTRETATASIVNGNGEVYETSPLNGTPDSKTLHRLDDCWFCGFEPGERLYGENVQVTNAEAPEATSSNNTFDYDPSNTHFDEAMAYYHSDEFEAEFLIGDLGMSSNQLTCQVNVEVHSDQFFARTFPDACDVFLADESFSSFFDNPAREASVITHEYMHVVSQTYNDLEQDFDAGALDEGYSDFFAVANRRTNTTDNSTRLGEFVGLAPERTVDNAYQLDDFLAGGIQGDLTNSGGYSVHDGGVVLAGALWDFTTDVATDVQEAATITLGSLQYLDADPSFYDARSALIAAANDAGKSYTCGIKQKFAEHGIGKALRALISGPWQLDEGEFGTWTADSRCKTGSNEYEWFLKYSLDDSWHPRGGGTSFTYGIDQISETRYMKIKVEITSGGETASARRNFIVNNNGGGGGGGGGGGDPCDDAVATNYVCLPGNAAATNGAGALAEGASVPAEFALQKSYPNPVQAGQPVTIPFALPEAAEVTLVVYDVLGQEVRRVEGGTVAAGRPRAVVSTEGLASGAYVYRLRARGTGGGSFTGTGKLVVVQ